jgi:hypothetical protein
VCLSMWEAVLLFECMALLCDPVLCAWLSLCDPIQHICLSLCYTVQCVWLSLCNPVENALSIRTEYRSMLRFLGTLLTL